MKSMMKTIMLLCLIYCYLGCGSSPPGDTRSARYLTPEASLQAFFEACAAMDTLAIRNLSHVDQYPLITSWKMRRIDSPRFLIRLSDARDSLASLDSELKFQKEMYLDSLRMIESAHHEVMNDRDLYSKAQAEWERAEEARIRAHDKASATIASIQKLYEAKEAANRRYVESSRRYSTQFANWYDRIKAQVEALKTPYGEVQERRAEISRLCDAATKSMHAEPPDTVSLFHSYAIVDLQIPSKLGIMLNKKCQVELLSTNGAKPYSKWLVVKLQYMGDQ